MVFDLYMRKQNKSVLNSLAKISTELVPGRPYMFTGISIVQQSD